MRDVMQDSGLRDAYANFHFLLLHCNYLIPSNTTLPSTERRSEIKQMCTCPQEEHVADNLCPAVTPDLAAFQIFGLAFSLYSIIQLIRVCIDKPTTLGYRKVISCAFPRHDVYRNKTFPN